MSLTDVPIGLAVTSAETGDSILRIGVQTSLKIAIVNNSGAAIALADGAAASVFGVYLPSPAFFTLDQLRAMRVTADGWAGTDAGRPERGDQHLLHPGRHLGRGRDPDLHHHRRRIQRAARHGQRHDRPFEHDRGCAALAGGSPRGRQPRPSRGTFSCPTCSR